LQSTEKKREIRVKRKKKIVPKNLQRGLRKRRSVKIEGRRDKKKPPLPSEGGKKDRTAKGKAELFLKKSLAKTVGYGPSWKTKKKKEETVRLRTSKGDKSLEKPLFEDGAEKTAVRPLKAANSRTVPIAGKK